MKIFRWLITFILILTIANPVVAASVKLSWKDNSNNETNFNIERATGGCASAVYNTLATVGAGITTFTDLAVVEDATYCWRVNASNPSGASAWSAPAELKVPFTVPVAPSDLIAIPGN